MLSGQDPQFIKNLFGSIAGTYDRANDAITFGMAHLWRSNLVTMSRAREGSHILDCATGTGDLAFAFAKHVGVSGAVTGLDFCPEMIELAQKKNSEREARVNFLVGDAMALPFSSASFDVTSIAYGIRNVADVACAVREMARVTRPGGAVMILETGEVANATLRAGVGFYFKNLVPRIGGWISGRRDAYEYLQKSSGAFPSGEKFCSMLHDLGIFSDVSYESLMGGASYTYKAVVTKANN
jgi:demethylmenaquinone methyltransferase / 2-methoxy-6-polyprenyl-1,4-benzoquinol methylase